MNGFAQIGTAFKRREVNGTCQVLRFDGVLPVNPRHRSIRGKPFDRLLTGPSSDYPDAEVTTQKQALCREP